MTATRSSLEAMRSINDKVLESAEKADEISSVVVQVGRLCGWSQLYIKLTNRGKF